MRIDDFAMWYFIFGIGTCFINGFVRKLEADGLLAFAWFLFWFMTPIGYLAKFSEWSYNKLTVYQPVRRTKIYILRNFF